MSDLGDRISSLSPAKRALLEQKRAQQVTRANGTMSGLPRRSANAPRVLSCAQHQLWFLDQLAPGSPAYNVPCAIHLHGPLNSAALQKSLDAVVGRHEILRTMYLAYQGKVIPAIAKQWAVELTQTDLRGMPDADVSSLLLRDSARPFDLARDLKIRAALYRVTDDHTIFVHVSHHIAWDLRSRTVFYEELEQFYGAFCDGGTAPSLPELPIQYADYALWQHGFLQGENLERLETYWKQQLIGAPAALELPFDLTRPAFQDLRGARMPVQLSRTTLETARALARDQKVTLYMVLLAAFYVFLCDCSGQDDLSVGSPFDARRHAETEPLIGMFINTLVLRIRLDGNLTFRQLLPRVREVVLGAIAHQDLPFEKIVDAVQPPRDLSRMPLFQANFRLQGPAGPPLHLAGTDIKSSGLVDNATAKFDLALELPSEPDAWGYWEYSTRLFRPETIQRMADAFPHLLEALFAQPDAPLTRFQSVPPW